MKPTLSNLESMQINASLETVEQLSNELRQARKDIEQWRAEYAKLQILQNDTNAKYGELVGKYEVLEQVFEYVLENTSSFTLIERKEWRTKAGLPTDK